MQLSRVDKLFSKINKNTKIPTYEHRSYLGYRNIFHIPKAALSPLDRF